MPATTVYGPELTDVSEHKLLKEFTQNIIIVVTSVLRLGHRELGISTIIGEIKPILYTCYC